MIKKLFTWVAAQFGYSLVPTVNVEAAVAKCDAALQYAQESGALNHPKRVKARAKVIAFAAAVKENLSDEVN